MRILLSLASCILPCIRTQFSVKHLIGLNWPFAVSNCPVIPPTQPRKTPTTSYNLPGIYALRHATESSTDNKDKREKKATGATGFLTPAKSEACPQLMQISILEGRHPAQTIDSIPGLHLYLQLLSVRQIQPSALLIGGSRNALKFIC